MDLTDLQVELRSIEEHVASLQTEIEKMKPKTGKEQKEDFEKITRIAKQSPLKDTEVSRVNEIIQKEYIRCLSWLIINSEGELYSKLLYLSRIAAGCKENISAEEIYQSGLGFETEDMARMCADFQKLKYPFLVDAMILVNLSGKDGKKDFPMIADMALVLGCDKKELGVIATVARAVLTKNFDVLKDIPVSEASKWSKKLSQFVPEEWLEEQRVEFGILFVYNDGTKDVQIQGKMYYGVEKILQNGTMVQVGEVLVIAKEYDAFSLFMSNRSDRVKKFIAPFSGRLCFVKLEFDNEEVDFEDVKELYSIYIVSQFDTYDA